MHYNQRMRLSIHRFLDKLRFNLMYLANPPWDTGIPVPELVDYISDHKPGRALDLGCGTGTNMAAFLEAGWEVDGVDIALLATIKARRKIKPYGDAGRVFFGSVTELSFLKEPYDLIYDIGCFHALSTPERAQTMRNIKRLLKKHGSYLLYAFCKAPQSDFGVGGDDLQRFSEFLKPTARLDSVDERGRDAIFLSYSKL